MLAPLDPPNRAPNVHFGSMPTPTDTQRLDRLANLFRRYAEVEFPAAGAPLYAKISEPIPADVDLLAMASVTRPGQPGPNLLFAAVHYLLLSGVRDPLADYYADVTPAFRPPDADAFRLFRDFCLAHQDDVRALVRSRLVQTNVIERCCALAPAFGIAHLFGRGRPLALIEVGCSAGLNLLWDAYHIDYGDGIAVGEPASPVRLQSEIRGDVSLPPFPRDIQIAARTGIDLAPVDINDDDAVLWQRALMWPERIERQQRLEAAIPIVRTAAARLLAGDACDLLPGALADAPPGALPCVFATYALYQFPSAARDRLRDVMRDYASARDVVFITMDTEFAENGDGALRLTHFTGDDGESPSRLLARCHPHGRWIAWQSA